jgi:hypothetical protein
MTRGKMEIQLWEMIEDAGREKFIQMVMDEAPQSKLAKWMDQLYTVSPKMRIVKALMSVMINLGCDAGEAKETVDATIALYGDPMDTPDYVQKMLKTHANQRANTFSTSEGAQRKEKQYDRAERVADAMAKVGF